MAVEGFFMTEPIRTSLKHLALGTALVATVSISIPRPAQADTASTALIVAGAASIVGALLIGANNQPYYVRDNQRYYVSQDEANYYRSHRHTVERQAWVPENEYPVGRNGGYHVQQQSNHNAQGHGYQGNGQQH